MSIRIPTAYEAGFGQKVKEAIPEYVKPPVTSNYVDTGAVGEAIGNGIADLGFKAAGVAIDQNYQKERLDLLKIEQGHKADLLEEKRQLAEVQKIAEAEQKTRESKAKVEMLFIQDDINRGVKDVLDIPGLSPTDRTTAFNERMDAVNQRYKDNIPQEFYDALNPVFAAHALNAKTSLADGISKQADDALLADGSKALALLETQAAENPQNRQLAKNQAGAIIAALPIAEKAKAEMALKFENTIDKNEVLNRLSAVGKDGYHTGLEAVLKALQKTGEGGAHTEYRGLEPSERTSLIGTAQTMIANEAKHKEAAQKAFEKEYAERVKNTLESYKEMKLSGMPVEPGEELRISKLVKGTEFEAKYLSIKNQGESAAFIFEKLEKDPLTFGAARLGLQVKPLNLTDQSLLSRGITERLQIGSKVKANLGLTFTPILTSDEVKGLTGLLKKDLPGAGVDIMDKLTRQLGGREVSGIAMQMTKEDPNIATVIRYVAAGDTYMARSIAKGQTLIETKAIKMPKEEELNAAFRNKAGGSLRGLPDNALEVYNAFKAHYAYSSQIAGVQDGSFDEEVFGYAFRRVVGDVVEFNGLKTVLPKDVKEEDFLNSVKRITSETIKLNGGVSGMDDKTAARKIREEGQFYLAGNGVYRVLVGGLPVRTADERRFLQFDLKSLDFTHPVSGTK